MSVVAANYAIRHCKLQDAAARHVLTVLGWASKPETPDRVYMTNADIREATGLRSANGVKDALRRLIDAGEVAVLEVGGRIAGTLGVATDFDLPGVRRHIESEKVSNGDGRYQMATGKVSDNDGRYQMATPNCRQMIPIEEDSSKDVCKTATSEPAPVAPVASQPSLPSPPAIDPISPPPKKRVSKKPSQSLERNDLDDQDWFRFLGTLSQFSHIDIGAEYGRCNVWCRNKAVGPPSRRRFINWLGRVEKPLSAPAPRIAKRNSSDDHYDRLGKLMEAANAQEYAMAGGAA